MLTYPLTWREDDKDLFSGLVRDEVLKVIDLPEPLRKTFQVEMICSEPVAVAAYVLWETIFQFRHANLALAASSLGNTTGSPELRLLVVDIGGGSTDIALIQIGWQLRRQRRFGGRHLQATGVDAIQPCWRPAFAHPGHGDLVLPEGQSTTLKNSTSRTSTRTRASSSSTVARLYPNWLGLPRRPRWRSLAMNRGRSVRTTRTS